ncbi:unnamed protein product [Cuscuta europaea]|uniref:Uncharacterized protein n=1 Tax=Cuscuta europaea TaxID=41803 RepID=A0A9P0ZBQ4_CUSEU|nr:unnamed protein product [Cuscuta europaea]
MDGSGIVLLTLCKYLSSPPIRFHHQLQLQFTFIINFDGLSLTCQSLSITFPDLCSHFSSNEPLSGQRCSLNNPVDSSLNRQTLNRAPVIPATSPRWLSKTEEMTKRRGF